MKINFNENYYNDSVHEDMKALEYKEKAETAAKRYGYKTWDDLLLEISKIKGADSSGLIQNERNYSAEMDFIAALLGHTSWEDMIEFEKCRKPNEYYDTRRIFPSFDNIICKCIYPQENPSYNNDDFEYVTQYQYREHLLSDDAIGRYFLSLVEYGFEYIGVTPTGGLVYKSGKRVIYIDMETAKPDGKIVSLKVITGEFK